MVFSNHIAGLYDHHYLLKNSTMTSNFIHIIITQRNDKSEANTFIGYGYICKATGVFWLFEEWSGIEDSLEQKIQGSSNVLLLI